MIVLTHEMRIICVRFSYKKELESGRRESEKQISEVRNQLLQQHQDELQRITQKKRRQVGQISERSDIGSYKRT